MFTDRKDAGEKLAAALAKYATKKCLVLALPRGGVPVGFEIARALKCPLDTIVARKLGAPGNPEYAIGAIASGVVVADVPERELTEVIREEKHEMERRIKKYKSGSYSKDLHPEVVIVVDDGIATGRTARAGIQSVRASYPDAKLIFAAPVGALDSVTELRAYADDVVCLEVPEFFAAVGQWYEHFDQTTDEEVISCLESVQRS